MSYLAACQMEKNFHDFGTDLKKKCLKGKKNMYLNVSDVLEKT